MTAKTRTIWTFAITSAAVFMATLDNLVVTTALPVIREDLHATVESLEWTVNAYTLTFAVLLLTGAALGDRFGRRRMLAVGLAIFTVVVRRRRTRAVGRSAHRRACGSGRRRRDHHPADADDPQRGRARQPARSVHRRVERHRRPRGRVRAARRRRGRERHLLALDLLAQRPDRHRPDPARAARGWTRRTGPPPSSTCPGVALASVGLTGIVWGLVRGHGQGWTSPEIVIVPRRRRARLRAVRALGAAHGGADAADALLPEPRLHARERRVPADVLRDVRLDLPAVAVLPDRAGLLAARLGPAHPPVDDHADVRRADRRRVSPTGSAARG